MDMCRREGPRCAEGHETKECVVLGKVVECVSGAGSRGQDHVRICVSSRVISQQVIYASVRLAF